MLTIALFALLFLSCSDDNPNSENLVRVTFYNESSYSVDVHEAYFDGSLLVSKLSPGNYESVNMLPNRNSVEASTFSIKYWHSIATKLGLENGDVWTGGIDPDMQITRNIKVGENPVIQIPGPSKLQLLEAFLKIQNTSNMPIEFMENIYASIPSVDNGELRVQSGNIGIYRFDSRIDGGEIKGYLIRQGNMNFYPFPELAINNGWVYDFEFHNDGTIIKIGEQSLIF
jgi:hypothetical protein